MITIEQLQRMSDYYVQEIRNVQHRRVKRQIVQFPTARRGEKACHFQYSYAHHHDNTICIRRSYFATAPDSDKVDTLAHELAHIWAHTHDSKKFQKEKDDALRIIESMPSDFKGQRPKALMYVDKVLLYRAKVKRYTKLLRKYERMVERLMQASPPG